jgi:hypothetical protein
MMLPLPYRDLFRALSLWCLLVCHLFHALEQAGPSHPPRSPGLGLSLLFLLSSLYLLPFLWALAYS